MWYICTSGKPTEEIFLKITSPSWKYCQCHLMNLIQLIDCWRTDDEFSWNNFYFNVVKEFWYGKNTLKYCCEYCDSKVSSGLKQNAATFE